MSRKMFVDGGFAYDTHFRVTGYWVGKAPWALDWIYHDWDHYAAGIAGLPVDDPWYRHAIKGLGNWPWYEDYDPLSNAVILFECRHNSDTARKIGVKRYAQSKGDPPRRIYVDRGGGDTPDGRTGPNIMTTLRQWEVNREEGWLAGYHYLDYWCDDFMDMFYDSLNLTDYYPPVPIGSVMARFIRGENGYTITVNTNANGEIEYYVGSDLAGIDDHVNFRVLGYWGSEVAFVEKWVEYTAPASDNTDEQYLSWGAETPSGLVEMVASVDATKTRDVTRVDAGDVYRDGQPVCVAAGPVLRTSNPDERVDQLNAITFMFPETNTTFPVVCGDHTVTKFYYAGHFPDANFERTYPRKTYRESGGWNRETSFLWYLGDEEYEDWENGGPYYYRHVSAMILQLTNGLAQFGNKGWSYLGARPAGSTVDRKVPVNEPSFGEIYSSYRSEGSDDNQWGQTGILLPTGLSSTEDSNSTPVKTAKEFGGYYEHWRDQRRLRDQYPYAWDQEEAESVTKEIGVVWFQGPEKDQPTLFPNNAYRTPMDMDDYPVWGGILCIDPNSLRETAPKGPIFFLLDSLSFSPGFRNKSGHFTATINDNKNITPTLGDKTQYSYLHSYAVYATDWYDLQADAIADRQAWYALNPTYPNTWLNLTRQVPQAQPEDPYELNERPYDMELFKPDTPWIRDNDEFWIGVQQGQPEIPNDNVYPGDSDDGFNASGFANNWDYVNGGRAWIMGGWITRRYYTYSENGEITAHIEGADYMDLWKHIPINLDFLEDNLSDEYSAARQILHEVNRQQPRHYRFNTYTLTGEGGSYDPGSLFGVDAATAMTKMVDDGSWQIFPNPNPGTLSNSLRRNLSLASKRRNVYNGSLTAGFVSPDFYSYSEGLWNDNYKIEYDENIRTIRSLLVDDNTQMLTDFIHVTDPVTFPRNPDLFCIPSLWGDRDEVSEKFHMLSAAPTHPKTGRVDLSLVRDDEGNPAICFRSWDKTQFYNVLHFSPVETWRVTRNKLPETDQYGETNLQHGNPFMLNADEWNRLKFKFRHASRASVDGGSTYKVRLHCLRNYGDDEDEWQSNEFHFDQDEWLDCYYEYDFTTEITDDEWTELSLPLLTDWTSNNSPDSRKIWGISFEVVPAESESAPYTINGKNFIRRNELTAPSSGWLLTINDPEDHFFRGSGFVTALSGEIVFDDPKPVIYVGDAGTYEQATIDAINGNYGGGHNIKLTRPLENAYVTGKGIYTPSGKAYGISRFRFEQVETEKELNLDEVYESDPAWLDNPRRIRVLDRRENFTDVENSRFEAGVRDENQESLTFKGVIDGDLRYHTGFDVWIDPDDPARSTAGIQNLLWLVYEYPDSDLRDLTYVVNGTDFYMVVDASVPGHREVTSESVDAETQQRNLQNRQKRTSKRFEVRE